MIVADHKPATAAHVPKEANVVVVMFVMEGCGACHEYAPTFLKVSREFTGKVPAYILDVNTPQGGQLADQYDVMATPTTLVLRRPMGALKAEGALDEASVRRLFTIAAAQR